MERINDSDLKYAQERATRALSAALPGREVRVDLHLGSREYRITNKLVVTVTRDDGTTRQTQVWRDAVAGYTKRDAYNAMNVMIATLAVTSD